MKDKIYLIFSASKSTFFDFNFGKSNRSIARSDKEGRFFMYAWFCYNVFLFNYYDLFSKIPVINIPSKSSAEIIREAWGLGDAGSLLEVSLTLSDLQPLDPLTQNWILGLWTIGMSIFEMPLIWLSRLGIPIFFSLLFINLLLWTFIFGKIWKFYTPKLGRFPVLVGAILLPLSWDFRYMLRDFIFYTESIGYGLLCLGLISFSLTFFYTNLKSTINYIKSGTLVGLSLLFRHTSESGLVILAGICVFLYLSNRIHLNHLEKSLKFKSKRDKTRNKKRSNFQENIWMKTSLIIFSLTALAITIPYRFIRSLILDSFNPNLSSASLNVPQMLWASPGSPNDDYWGWAGGNWACKMDENLCSELQANLIDQTQSSHFLFLAIRTALTEPLEFVRVRAFYLLDNWIPGFSFDASLLNLIAAVFFVSPILIVIIVNKFRNSEFRPIILLWGSFLLMHVLQLLVIHYESRYFIPIRLLILGFLINLLMIPRSQASEIKS